MHLKVKRTDLCSCRMLRGSSRSPTRGPSGTVSQVVAKGTTPYSEVSENTFLNCAPPGLYAAAGRRRDCGDTASARNPLWLDIAKSRVVVFPSCLIAWYDQLVRTGGPDCVQRIIGTQGCVRLGLLTVVVIMVSAFWVPAILLDFSPLGLGIGSFLVFAEVMLWKRLWLRRDESKHGYLILPHGLRDDDTAATTKNSTLGKNGTLGKSLNLPAEEHNKGTPSSPLPPGLSDMPSPTSVQFPGSSRKSFQILQYNVFLRCPASPGGAQGYGTEEYKDSRLEQIIARLGSAKYQNLDAVCVQELFSFGSFRQERMLAGMYRLGYRYFISSPRTPLCGYDERHGWPWSWIPNLYKYIDGGCMIISKHPIERGANFEWPTVPCKVDAGRGGDLYVSKGAQYARLRLSGAAGSASCGKGVNVLSGGASNGDFGRGEGTLFHLFNLHMQCSELLADRDGSQVSEITARQFQGRYLTDFVKSCLEDITSDADATSPIVLSGDWNMDAHSHRGPEKVRGSLASFRSKKLCSLPARPSDEYMAMVDILKRGLASWEIRDAMLESCGEHPVTFGDVNVLEDGRRDVNASSPTHRMIEAVDTVMTDPNERCCQAYLDYTFVCEFARPGPPHLHPLRRHASALPRLNIESEIDKFHSTELPVCQLSDHYAVFTKMWWGARD